MLENESFGVRERHPILSILITLLAVVIGFVAVGPAVGFLLAMPFYQGSITELAAALQSPTGSDDVKVPLYIIQGCATLFGLILVPLVLLQRESEKNKAFFKSQVPLFIFLIAIVIVMSFMAVNSIFIEWNSKLDLPDFAQGFEDWMREKEIIAEQMTRFLTTFDSQGQLLLALVVIAVLPAVGEELVFRGMIQHQLLRASGNIHFAIWFSAILFSALHLQFFGFVPRMLLGALFGYLYFWSGNLWVPILAHFINNGLSVIALYFYQRGSFEYDLDKPEAAPAHVLIFAALATAGLLYYFYQYFNNRHPSVQS